jgi:hypothetical protein
MRDDEMTSAMRALALSFLFLLCMEAAVSAEEARALVMEGEAQLAANRPKEALETFRRVRALLGTAPPRLQADLVRAAAALNDDVTTRQEYAAWLRLERRDAAVDAELRALAMTASERLQDKQRREREAAQRAEQERQAREAQASARAAAEVRYRESSFQEAARDADAALRRRDVSAAEAAIRRIDRTTTSYPDRRGVLSLRVARANLVAHAALVRAVDADNAAALSRQREEEGASRRRGHYVAGTLKLVGGAALAAGGGYLLVAMPIGETPSYLVAGPAIGLGLGMIVFMAPNSFRAASHAAAPRTWSVAAAGLPGGAFVSATGSF